MTLTVIIANILSGLGTILMLVSTFLKTKKSMLKISVIDYILNTIANILIKGYSAAVVNIIGGIRDYFVYKNKMNNKLLVLFITSAFVIAFAVNQQGWIGFIPIISEIEYGIGTAKVKDGVGYKIILAINYLMWIVYCMCTKLYVPAILYAGIVISSIINIIKNKKILSNNL